MKRLFSEKILVLALFGVALFFFYVANEDTKKLGVLQKTNSSPSLFMSNRPDSSSDASANAPFSR